MNIIHLSRKKLPNSPRPGKDYFVLQNPMTTDLPSGLNRTAQVMPAEKRYLQSVAQVWQADGISLINAEMTGIRLIRFASRLLFKA